MAKFIKGVSGHQPPQQSALNKGGRKGNYTDQGTLHSMPPGASPGPGFVDKHEATRHSRKSLKTNRFV
jgi:hypothetical protein